MIDKDPQAHTARLAWLVLQIIGAGLIVALAAYAPIISGTAHARSDPAPGTTPFSAAAAGLTPTEKMLVASDGEAYDNFGSSVGASGDLILAGAYAHLINGNSNQGAAYLFARNQGGAGTWGRLKVLTATDGAFGDKFGWAAALDGDFAVVGAPQHTVGVNTGQGAAYVFARDQGGADNWGQLKQLVASDGEAFDQFGYAVAVSGDIAVVGASWHTVGADSAQGAAYVFARNQGGADNWGFVKKLTVIAGNQDDNFGASVSASGDTIVVGAPYHAVGLNASQGEAYVFARNQGGADNWGLVKTLTASDGAANDEFGTSVAVYSQTAVVGAWLHRVVTDTQGAAYVYQRDQGGAGNWGETRRLVASDASRGDNFGLSVAIFGDRIAAGAPYNDGAQGDQGAAYLFARNQGGAGLWGQSVKLTASAGGITDTLGSAVAISGATVVAGAPLRDVGLNTDQGATYVFELLGTAQNYFLFLPAIRR